MATESSTLNIEPGTKAKVCAYNKDHCCQYRSLPFGEAPPPCCTPNKSVAQQTKGATNWKSVGKLENIIWFLFCSGVIPYWIIAEPLSWVRLRVCVVVHFFSPSPHPPALLLAQFLRGSCWNRIIAVLLVKCQLVRKLYRSGVSRTSVYKM